MCYFLEIDYACYIHIYFKRRRKNIGIIMNTNLFTVVVLQCLLREYKLFLRHRNLETCCVNIFCVPSDHFIATYVQYLPISSLTLTYWNTAPRIVCNAICKIFIVSIDYVNVLTKTCSIIYLNHFLNAFI
jgi:hypothetical protein